MNVYTLQELWSDDIVHRVRDKSQSLIERMAMKKLKQHRPDYCYNCGRLFDAFVVQKINPNWMAERCQHCKADVCYTRIIVADVLAEVVNLHDKL